MGKVIFKTPISEQIENFKTREKCLLVSNEDSSKHTEKDVQKVVVICNQKPVYNFLFRTKLNGKVYGEEQAKGFMKWMEEGWQKQEWFVFLIRNSNDEIIGAVDLKSNSMESCELGYWADANHNGLMSNAVARLMELARKAGYKELFATTMPNNERSQNVLIRNGFERRGEMEKPGGLRYLFKCKLI
jgi:RimJ/RimL family protein N-acetyltransferase